MFGEEIYVVNRKKFFDKRQTDYSKYSQQMEEIIFELEQCREDERNSRSQIIQIIVTAATVLGVIFGATFLTKDKTEINHSLFILSIIIFCASFSYITYLGTENVLRFHYMRDLEDRLSFLVNKKCDIDQFQHWMGFSSPLLTKNIKHLNVPYSKRIYYTYALPTIFSIIFCVGVIICILFQIKNNFNFLDKIAFLFFIVMFCFCIYMFIYGSSKAKDMYIKSKIYSYQEQKKRFNNIQQKQNKFNFRKVILYYVYPKTKDIQKSIILVIGFFIGNFLSEQPIEKRQFFYLISSLFVIEFLIYQARYLLNDIRGIAEDVAAGKKDRLPVDNLDVFKAIKISLIVIVLRILCAFGISIYLMPKIGYSLLICSFGIILLTILYEYARERQINYLIFILVSFGYPLRLLAGIWVAYPKFWTDELFFGTVPIQAFKIIFTLLVSFCFYGEFSAIIPWVHEAIVFKKENKEISKKHYNYLIEMLGNRLGEKSMLENEFPLKQKGRVSDLWNVSFILSVLCISIYVIMVQIYTSVNIIILLELLFILLSVVLCGVIEKRTLFLWEGIMIILISKIIIYNILCTGQKEAYFILSGTQILYVNTYFYLRYFFDPSFDFNKVFINFKVILNNLKRKIIGLVLGKKTVNFINKIPK